MIYFSILRRIIFLFTIVGITSGSGTMRGIKSSLKLSNIDIFISIKKTNKQEKIKNNQNYFFQHNPKMSVKNNLQARTKKRENLK